MEQLMNTINGTAARAKRDGLGISTNLLRSLCKSNTLPHVKAGSTVLINYQVLLNYLYTGSAQPEPAPGHIAGQIQAIPEKLRAVR